MRNRTLKPHPAAGRPAAAAAACAAAGLIIVALLLTGCAAGPGSATGSSVAGSAAAPAAGSRQGPPAMASRVAPGVPAARGGRRPSPGGTARLAAAGPDIVYTASMTVRVHDIGGAATDAARIAARARGYVSRENITPHQAKRGSEMASLQLKIPAAVYPTVLADLAALGVQTSLRQQAQDITQQVVDTASRVASDRAAITQLRALLARAGSVASLLNVQDQINAQESALEAMLAQQRALDHETAYATVSLRLVLPAVAHHAHKKPPRAAGFVGGLEAGWNALVTAVSWLLRALGAVLPIGLACALAGYLGYRGLRGRRWAQRRGTRPAAGDSTSSAT